MATMVTITTTPKRQGTVKVQEYPTLIEARGAVLAMSDRNLTPLEMEAWKKHQ